MGQLFCCRMDDDGHQLIQNQSLLQINRYIQNIDNDNEINKNNKFSEKESKIQNNNYNLNENLISKNGKYNMIFYDINKNQSILMERKLDPIKTLEGLSELNFNNNLYLCGTSSLIPEDNKGSYLFQLNPLSPETKILSKSKYSHYYPALISVQNKYIYCIGGKNNFHCESYCIKENKWLPLPNLSEERYLCTLCYDEFNNILYLFGGINEKNSLHGNNLPIEYKYFLRLRNDINNALNWEKIEIKNNNILLNRISAASLIFENEEKYIYIFGGKDDQGHLLDDVIKFYTESQSFQQSNQKLDFPTEFMNQYAVKSDLNKFLYAFLDKYNNPIIIDKHNYVDYTFDELKI